MIPVGLQVGIAAEQSLQRLVGGNNVVKAHDRHGVLHAGVVRVKGDDVGNAQLAQLLKGHGTVQGFAVIAPVLAAAVQQGHDDVDAVCFAARRLDDPLQILKMVVGGHGVFLAEQLVGAAVIAHIHQDEQVVTANAGFDDALAVTGGEAGTLRLHQEIGLRSAALLRPGHQMAVDLFPQLLCAVERQDA